MSRISIGDIQLNVTDRGRGAPLLLVHGFPLDHTMWQPQIDELSSHYRVIAPDLRGFGRSDVSDGTVAMEQLADDLAALLDALHVNGPVSVCGLSMGGYVVWQLWRRHRQRLQRLILCDTRAAADTPEAADVRRTSAQRALVEGAGFLADTMLGRLFAPSTQRDRPELVQTVRRTMETAPAIGVAAALHGMAERPDSTPLLPHIDLPTLVLCGQLDVISPPDEMRGMADAIPGARFVEIPAAGHLAPLENPGEVNRALREFLSG